MTRVIQIQLVIQAKSPNRRMVTVCPDSRRVQCTIKPTFNVRRITFIFLWSFATDGYIYTEDPT